MIQLSQLKNSVIIGTIGLFSFVPSIAYSQNTCVANRPTEDSIKYSKIFVDAPVIDSENTNLQKDQWSTPIIVRDSFTEKEKVVVVDRDYEKGFIQGQVAERGVDSVWGQKSIKVISYLKYRDNTRTSEVSALSIKINGQVFNLDKEKNNFFLISPELQEALNISPVPKVSMRITTLDSNTHTGNIGEKTIKTWQSINATLRAFSNQNGNCEKN